MIETISLCCTMAFGNGNGKQYTIKRLELYTLSTKYQQLKLDNICRHTNTDLECSDTQVGGWSYSEIIYTWVSPWVQIEWESQGVACQADLLYAGYHLLENLQSKQIQGCHGNLFSKRILILSNGLLRWDSTKLYCIVACWNLAFLLFSEEKLACSRWIGYSGCKSPPGNDWTFLVLSAFLEK